MNRKLMASSYSVLAVHGEANLAVGVPEDMLGTLGSSLLDKLGSVPGFLQEKCDQILQPETRSAVLRHGDAVVGSAGNVLGNMGSFLLEKLRELLHFLESIPGFIQEKLDRILPPETRSATLHHWLVFGLTVVLPVALSLLCLYYCCKCCCCTRAGRKMMKAPGRMGRLMPRATFEADPRGYFIDLRASRELLR